MDDSNSFSTAPNSSFSSPTKQHPPNGSNISSSGLGAVEGKYFQRLRQLEKDNELWRQRFEELYQWKEQVEKWMIDQFEFKLEPLPTGSTFGESENYKPETSSLAGDSVNITIASDIFSTSVLDSTIASDTQQPSPTRSSPRKASRASTNGSEFDMQEPSTSKQISDELKSSNNITIAALPGPGLATSSPACPPKKRKAYSEAGAPGESAPVTPAVAKKSKPTPVISPRKALVEKTKILGPSIHPKPGPASVKRAKAAAAASSAEKATPMSLEQKPVIPQTEDGESEEESVKLPIQSSGEPNQTAAPTRTTAVATVSRSNGNVASVDSPRGEVDEDARCSVCDDKYAEEENEMMFCDSCNICVHQACYGVKEVPLGKWYCKPCAAGLTEKPRCLFCPNPGGAMVPVSSPSKVNWAHVFCALWIPEIGFKNKELMDIVVNIQKIDSRRWKMKCSLCNLKSVGVCIQCHYKRCSVAFHVTCASKHHLKMDGILDDNLKDGVALQAYCNRHRHKAD